MTRFFTSDLHLRHAMVVHPDAMNRGRGRWATVEEHDDELIANINGCVGKDDELYILGDIAWADLPKLRPRITCRHIKVVLGNHDTKGKLINVFGEAPDTRIIKDFGGTGLTCFLSHYPHAFWPASHHGHFHLYGHMHDQREVDLDRMMPDRRSMDCGVDTAARLLGEFRPFREQELADILVPRSGHDPLDYYLKLKGQR